MDRRRVKESLASLLHAVGASQAIRRVNDLAQGRYVRVLHYHGVPETLSDRFERQLRFFGERFTPVGREQLVAFLGGEWEPPGPRSS